MSVGYRPTPYTVPPARSSSRLLRRDSAIRRLDWALLLAVLALSAIGCALVWSATRPALLDSGEDPQAFLKKHIINISVGLTLGLVASLFDYRMLRAYAPILYLLSIGGLVAVLTPLGSTINGSHSWIILPAGFSVQPSEFAKVALVVGMAMLLAEKRDAEEDPRDIDVLLALAFAGVPLALVLLQPDLGTVLVVCALVLGVIAVSGAPIRWVLGLVVGAVLVATVAIQVGVLKDYQLDRFRAFYDPAADPKGVGYNVRQAQIAIGSGGVHGEGLLHGAQTQGKFVPAQQTDFIFTVAGEELGFVGAAGIVLLLGIILWRVARIAMGAEDLFGRLVAAGVLCWFAFQAFENIGMTIGIMPVTGVPLPFVSYGGSSMFANLLAIGLLQNVHMRRYT
ncbi:MAG: rod shape determining protein RodA [Actinomycetota bacterium]|jgi:rod shape determining protein RodA|nr:rod shape determining protein RodA [Actinomycetota bacterium]